jgi:hypothetical protein
MAARHLLTTCTALLIVACGGSSPEPPASPGRSEFVRDLTSLPGNTFKVTWNPATVVIDRATAVRALRSVSADDRVLVFDGAEPALSALEPGRVLVLERIALRKVAAVKRENGQLAVLTEAATLPEAIQDGEIRWNIPVRFDALMRASQPRARVWGLIPVVHAAQGYHLSGKKHDWTYDLTAVPGPQRVNLNVTVTKDLNGIEAALQATGYIPDFDTLASVSIAGGAVNQMSFENRNLGGEVDFTFTAATKDKPGGFGKKQLRLPAILKAPFFLGMLPLTLEIGSAITFTPGLGAKNQLAKAKFHAAYSQLSGFSFAGGSSGAQQNGSSDGTGEILDATGITNAGIGVVVGVSMPRLEFKLGTSSIVDMLEKALPTGIADVFARTFLGDLATKGLEGLEESIKVEGAAHVQVVLVGTLLASGPISLLPCQKATFNFRADAGADATLLGKKLGEMSLDLFKKEIVKTHPPNIKCG